MTFKDGDEFVMNLVAEYCPDPSVSSTIKLDLYFRKAHDLFYHALDFVKEGNDARAYIGLMRYAQLMMALATHNAYSMKQYEKDKNLNKWRLNNAVTKLEELKPKLVQQYNDEMKKEQEMPPKSTAAEEDNKDGKRLYTRSAHLAAYPRPAQHHNAMNGWRFAPVRELHDLQSKQPASIVIDDRLDDPFRCLYEKAVAQQKYFLRFANENESSKNKCAQEQMKASENDINGFDLKRQNEATKEHDDVKTSADVSEKDPKGSEEAGLVEDKFRQIQHQNAALIKERDELKRLQAKQSNELKLSAHSNFLLKRNQTTDHTTIQRLSAEKEKLQESLDAVAIKRDALKSEYNALQREMLQLRGVINSIQIKHKATVDSKQAEHNALVVERVALKQAVLKLQSAGNSEDMLQGQIHRLKQEIKDLEPLKAYADDLDFSTFDQQRLMTMEKKLEDKLKRIKDAKQNMTVCIVCQDSARNHVFVPCGHFCVCGDCKKHYEGTDAECPICRVKVSHVVRMFHA